MQEKKQRSTETIRMVIAEDHHIVRDALQARLQAEAGIEVVGEARDGKELFSVVAEQRPDLVMMDARMPYHEPSESVRELHRLYPGMKVLILSMHKSPSFAVEIFRAGVDGYLLKDDAPDYLFQAIRQVMDGKRWVSPKVALVAAYFAPRGTPGGTTQVLSERELELLVAMAMGQRDEQIAERLMITENSVRDDINGIFRRLESPYQTNGVAV